MLSRATRFILIATVLFTALNICVKYLPHIPASQLVFFRGLITLFISGFYAKKKKLALLGNNKKILILRGFFGTVSLFILFYCLQRMPLAMATVISNLAPLFTVVIAHYLLKEKAAVINAILLLVAFLGVLFVKGWDPRVPWQLAFLGIGGAIAAACAYTCVRVLRHSDDPMIVIFYFPLISIPMMFLPMYWNWVSPSFLDWCLILVIGVLTQMAQYYMTFSYQLEKAAKIMVYNYAGVLWSVLLGYFLFSEVFSLAQFLGVGLIFLAIVVSSVDSSKEKTTV